MITLYNNSIHFPAVLALNKQFHFLTLQGLFYALGYINYDSIHSLSVQPGESYISSLGLIYHFKDRNSNINVIGYEMSLKS